MSNFSLIIVAGGSGTRMQHAQKKAFIEIHRQPILLHTLRAFASRIEITERIIVLPEAELNDLTGNDSSFEMHGYSGKDPLILALQELDVTRLVVGGKRRQDSVLRGLKATSDSADYVLIHDAARPFVDADSLESLMKCVVESGAAILAHPVRDTLKQVDADANIVGTVSRDNLWGAQTPQAFKRDLLQEAYSKHNTQDVTDDASIIALAGTAVNVVDGGAGNFKITTPADLKIAEALIEDDRECLRKLTAKLPAGTDYEAKTRVMVRPNSAIFTELPSNETLIELKPGTEKTDQLPAVLALFHAGHIEAALVGAAEIVEFESDNAQAHLLMGECFHQLGQIERALLMAENAISADSQNANAWRLKGELLLEEDHESEAGMAALAAARALRHQQHGREKQARKQHETAIRLDSSLEKLM